MTDHPTASVQDDDAEWLRELASYRSESADDIFDAEDRERLERIASRLSPTSETGLARQGK